MKHVSQVFGQSKTLSAYKDQLQTDQWREFATEIKSKFGYKCQMCHGASGDQPIDVHHIFYDSRRKLWEYKDTELLVLCRPCHQECHQSLQDFRQAVFGRLTASQFRVLNAALAVGLSENDPLMLVHAIASMCSSPRSIERFAIDWNRTQDVIKKSKTLSEVTDYHA